MSKKITDVEAVNQLCEKTGGFYSKAQSLQSIGSDAEALVNYRSALKVLLTTLAERHGISLTGEYPITTIHEDIRTVAKNLKLNIHIENLMDKIRESGNKGSHPESYLEEDFRALVQSTKINFLELVSKLPSTLTGIESDIEINESDNCIELKELSYQALCLDDDKAAYMVANYLLTSNNLLHNHTVNVYGFYHRTLDKVVPLLESCYITIAPAAYCLAKLAEAFGTEILSKNVAGNYGDSLIPRLLQRAAYREDIRAEYEYGVMVMEGKPPFEQDPEEGLELLEHSSAYGESRASIYLSKYYDNNKQAQLCEMYLKRSAEQGLAESKIEYACFLLNSGDVSHLYLAKVYLEDALVEEEVKVLAAYWLAKVLEAVPEKPEDYTERLSLLYTQASNCRPEEHPSNRWLEISRKLDRLEKSHEALNALMWCAEMSKKEGNEKLYLFSQYILGNTNSYITADHKLVTRFSPLLHENYHSLQISMAPKDTPDHTGSKVGRNEQCPCGSGKKFKKCCGN
ncbi:SEC-C domain-containing protein [Photobacterium sagamiensis]|uniref:SEC-C metal-binding domain-containing protein n=1 Tax=Photobacterium sagamiensis TaxID=2910241 RepID=UPI003D1069FF